MENLISLFNFCCFGGGHHWFFPPFLMFFLFVFFIFMISRWRRGSWSWRNDDYICSHSDRPRSFYRGRSEAKAILKKRYASGEINKNEYESMLKDIC